MNEEELNTLHSMCKSLKALREKLSICEDCFHRQICKEITDLETLINDESTDNDSLVDNIINKLKEINHSLQKMSFQLALNTPINHQLIQFGTNTKELPGLPVSGQLKKNSMN